MINKKHIPCVAGSTGLVGSFLLKNLSNLYPKVISLTRKKVNYSADNISKAPIWHHGADLPSWIFADELIIE